MGLIRWIKETFGKMFLRKEAKDVFGIDISSNSKMDSLINQWYNITGGNPTWLDAEDDIESINFAQFIESPTNGRHGGIYEKNSRTCSGIDHARERNTGNVFL